MNDTCAELMQFYRFIKGETGAEVFEKEMYAYVDNWEKVPRYTDMFCDEFLELYHVYRSGQLADHVLAKSVTGLIRTKIRNFNGLFKIEFCVDRTALLNHIVERLIDKIIRMRVIERDAGAMGGDDILKNIETAFRGGFYTHFRDLPRTHVQMSRPKAIANYYFVREFCYGSMFRFNGNGEFNIPYGGMAYNRKDFRKKVDRIFSPSIKDLFSSATIMNTDFEEVFRRHKPTKRDFVFVDPPYDSEFSEYEGQDFGRDDHQRLANTLLSTSARFLLVIKNTDFILDLYNNKNTMITRFDKQYTYNMRGRNDRDTEHLIIRNF